jgi:hypothetical protein
LRKAAAGRAVGLHRIGHTKAPKITESASCIPAGKS